MSGVKLVMYLDYGSHRRDMTVCRAPGSEFCYSKRSGKIEQKPELRIANRFLLESGFRVGSRVCVEYGENVITVRKLNKQNENTNATEAGPIPDTGKPSPVAAVAQTVGC